jgi:hypothetical protein
MRSTTELRQHSRGLALQQRLAGGGPLAEVVWRVKVLRMPKPDPEALAKALRENLRKRKEQGRESAPPADAPAAEKKS